MSFTYLTDTELVISCHEDRLVAMAMACVERDHSHTPFSVLLHEDRQGALQAVLSWLEDGR